MTFSEAFYGTYKIDKKDGKPHLKERIFAPVDGFWSGVMIFGGVVGTCLRPFGARAAHQRYA